MITVRVHIKSENTYLDKNVFVDITLPAIPRVGEYLHLREFMQVLEDLAKKDLITAGNYYPKWFYFMDNYIDPLKKKDIHNLSFADAIRVDSVAYYPNDELVYIELDDE